MSDPDVWPKSPFGERHGPTPEEISAGIPLVCSDERHAAKVAALESEIYRLGLMVDTYSAGASALSDKIRRVREVLPFAEQVVATSGPGPASAVRAVIDWLVAALDGPTDTAADIPADKSGPAIPNVQVGEGEVADNETDTEAPELTAEEARDLADDLGNQLYRAQDALDFVEECCVIAERTGRPITVADVRTWLKGAQCGRQLAAGPGFVIDPAAPPVHLVTWTGPANNAEQSARTTADNAPTSKDAPGNAATRDGELEQLAVAVMRIQQLADIHTDTIPAHLVQAALNPQEQP